MESINEMVGGSCPPLLLPVWGRKWIECAYEKAVTANHSWASAECCTRYPRTNGCIIASDARRCDRNHLVWPQQQQQQQQLPCTQHSADCMQCQRRRARPNCKDKDQDQHQSDKTKNTLRQINGIGHSTANRWSICHRRKTFLWPNLKPMTLKTQPVRGWKYLCEFWFKSLQWFQWRH